MAPRKRSRAKAPRRGGTSAIDRMSYAQLLALQARITAAIADRRKAEKAELAQKLERLAASSGFSLPEIIGKGRGRKKTVAAVRYRHPSDPKLTWSGRGRRPKWLARAGRNIERYRVA